MCGFFMIEGEQAGVGLELMRLSAFIEKLRAEKISHSYTVLEWKYGVNRKYIWKMLNKRGYKPPRSVRIQLGIYLKRARCLRKPTIEIRKDDPASAARSIRDNVYFDVDELIEELRK